MPRLLVLTALLLTALPAHAQDPPKHEFRSAWVATALGLDYPPSGTAEQQETALRTIIRTMKAQGMNAVVFQASPRGDAYYNSERLPWARRLSGTMGQDPGWDPLAVAIEEAHALGMELHAWYNVGKIGDIGGDLQDTGEPRHLYFAQPDWTVTLGTEVWLNPGIPEARAWTVQNVMEIVRNYDVDAVHFDFIRYGAASYPGDAALRDEHDPDMVNLQNWRRENITRIAHAAHDSIKAVKPWVKVGSTPLGHYQTSGGWAANLAFYDVYQDSRGWLRDRKHDYLAPQIYWDIGSGSGRDAPEFEWLVRDWQGGFGRHIYIGTAPYKGTVMAELPQQIDTTRAYDTEGQIHFRYNFVRNGSPFGDRYDTPSLVPPMEWLDMTAPASPTGLAAAWEGEEVTLTWSPTASEEADSARFFALYRIPSATEPDYETALADARNLLAVIGDTTFTDRPWDIGMPYHYVVTGVSRNWVESAPSEAVVLEGVAVSTEEDAAPLAFGLDPNYPNPFSARTTLAFSLERPAAVKLQVFDVLGRVVATLEEGTRFPAGRHTVDWDGAAESGARLGSGTYFVRLEAGGQSATRALTLVR